MNDRDLPYPANETKALRLSLIAERAEALAERATDRAVERRLRAHRNSGRGRPPSIAAEEHVHSRPRDWIDLASESVACSVREVGA